MWLHNSPHWQQGEKNGLLVSAGCRTRYDIPHSFTTHTQQTGTGGSFSHLVTAMYTVIAHTAFGDGSLKTVPLRRVVVANAFNHSIQEAEADESLGDRGQPCLQSEFRGSQGYTEKPYLKQNKWKINKKPTTSLLTKQTTTTASTQCSAEAHGGGKRRTGKEDTRAAKVVWHPL